MDNTNVVLRFKLSFDIDTKEYDFYQIRDKLGHSLFKDKYKYHNKEYRHNDTAIIYSVINDCLQEHFSFSRDIRAYMTDYSEKKGSFVVSFSILVIGAITNYASIRATIDRFAEDIERLFANSLNQIDNERYYAVTPNVQDFNNQQAFLSQQLRTNDTNQYDILRSKIKLNRIFIGIISFVLILLLVLCFSNISIRDFSNTNTKEHDKINELIIRKIVEDEIRNQKIDNFLNNIPINKIEKVE